MTYQNKTKALVKAAPSTLGVRLGKAAIKHNVSVQRISELSGASRMTVYSWISGRSAVSNSYRETVKRLIRVIKQKKK